MGSAPASKITAPKTADSAIRTSPKDKALVSGREERGREIRRGCRGKVRSALPLDASLCTAESLRAGVSDTDEIGMTRSAEIQAASRSKAEDLKMIIKRVLER